MTKIDQDDPGKIRLIDRFIILKDNLANFLNAIYLGEETFSFFTDKLFNAIKVLIVATRKFIDDDCFTQASSIAYTLIISLIPALTVALTIYSAFKGVAGQKDEIFRMAATYMQDYNIQINIDPFFEAISVLIDNAGRIGGIGAAVMIFTSTALLRSLENSLNHIYRVRRQRNIFMKVVYYWAALTLGPIMLITATTVATQVTEALSAPTYNSAFSQDKKIWVVGNNGTLRHSPTKELRFTDMSKDSINLDNMRRYHFDRTEKTISRTIDQTLRPVEIATTRFVDIQFIGDNGWVIGREGVLLSTLDGGHNWNVKKYDRLRFNAIHMINPQTGFIAGAESLLLKTTNGGDTWSVIKSGENFSDFRSIHFKNNIGIVTGTRAIILITENYGETWESRIVNEAVSGQRHLNINNAAILDNNDIIIVGDAGTILKSSDAAVSWRQKNFSQSNYQTVYFFDSRKGVIGAERRNMIFTEDGGLSWQQKSLPDYHVNEILYSENKLWVIGETGMVMTTGDIGESWDGFEGRSILAFAINFFAPFVFIWLLFLLAYMSLPNTRVPFRPAAVGAAFTGAVWVIFILMFISYVQAFATVTFAIYGALVAIPLFLLLVYCSALIILYGAEVSYTLMHSQSYATLKKAFSEEKDELNIFNGINMLLTVYGKFEKGDGSASLKELHRSSSHDDTQADNFIKIFMENGILAQDTEGNFFPTRSSEKIKISEIIDLIHSITFTLPPGARRSPLKIWLSELFKDMSKSRNRVLKNVTVRDLIQKQKLKPKGALSDEKQA